MDTMVYTIQQDGCQKGLLQSGSYMTSERQEADMSLQAREIKAKIQIVLSKIFLLLILYLNPCPTKFMDRGGTVEKQNLQVNQ